jgi:hypothetical protein
VRYFPHFIAAQGYISLLAYFGVLIISLLPRAIFHCLPSAIFYSFHSYPGLYFIACLLWCFIATQGYISLLAWCDILPISFLSRAIFHCLSILVFYPFHCYPGPYFIACLVRYFPHFIATQGYISLLAYSGVSLLPRGIFHCLPSAIFYPFHSYPGLYFIACLLWCFSHFISTQGCISLLARAIFHCLPTLVFYTFHCYPGVYFIACLVRYFTYFIPIQGYISLLVYFGVLPISLLPRAIFHCLPSAIFYPFHCYPGLYFIACLHWCFSYFISTQAYISLLA